MLSAAQTKFYWRLWAAAKATGLVTDNDRRAAHAAAGCPESSKAFTNADLTKWKRYCEALANPDSLAATIAVQHPENDQRAQLLHRITELTADLGAAYVRAIMLPRFGTDDPESLSNKDLDKLRITLIERTRSRARAGRAARDEGGSTAAASAAHVAQVSKPAVSQDSHPAELVESNNPF